MTANEANMEVPEPEQVVGFFVPTRMAAYVTEMIELALKDTSGITVSAGTLAHVARPIGIPLAALADHEALPDVESSELEDPVGSTTKTKSKKKKRKGHKWSKQRRSVTRPSHGNEPAPQHESSPETANHCCMHQMAHQLAQKYGEPVSLPNGKATAPRLLIQYPDLPYPVPVHQEFPNLGIPRERVNIRFNAVFTPNQDQLLPILRQN